MKIAGVKYSGVQRLTGRDITAPMRLATAQGQALEAEAKVKRAEGEAAIAGAKTEAGMAEAWSEVIHKGFKTVSGISERIAHQKRDEALNVYNAEKLKWENEQEARDENGDAAWDNGQQRFNDADDAARAAVNDIIGGNPYASQLFDVAADKANVNYGQRWLSKVKSWQGDHLTSVLTTKNETERQRHNYDVIDENIAEAAELGTISQTAAAKMRIRNKADKTNHSYNVNIAASISTEQFNKLHEKITADTQLNDEAKLKKRTQLDNHIIDTNGAIYRDQLQNMVKHLGLDGAVVAGDKMLKFLSATTDQESDGLSSEKARHSSVVHFKGILNEFKTAQKNSSGLAIRQANANRQDPVTTNPTSVQAKGNDDYVAQNIYGYKLVGDGSKYDREGAPTFKDILNPDGSGRHILAKAAVHSANGIVDKESRNVLDASLTSNDKDIIGEGMRGIAEFIKYNPNTLRENMEGNVKLATDMVEAVGYEEAATIYAHGKSVPKLEEKALKEKYDTVKKDYDFESTLEDVAPHKGWIWDSSPEYRASYKKAVEDMVPKYMTLTNGNVEASYRIAMKRVLKDKGVDQTIGQIVKHPFATSVYGGDIAGEGAFHDDIKSSFKSDVHINGGDVPDEYSYYPANNFNGKTNPSYIVTWMNDAGEVKMMGYTADFGSTDAGKAHFKELSDRQAEAVRQHKNAQMKVLAESSDEAWKNAPNGLKIDSAIGVLKESAGGQLNRVSQASSALADWLGEIGTSVYEATHVKMTPAELKKREKGRAVLQRKIEKGRGERTRDWESRVERGIR